ncbi:MAG: hypothetical protein PHW04_17230 [Candidatus Wallbacteria bacterium]|nr:hypothetical protein [Candidatus Wallbacteria bacterium]
MDKNKLKSVVCGIVILASGIAIGSGLSLNILWKSFMYHLQFPEPAAVIQDMKKHLDLSDDQAAKILVFMNRNKSEMETLNKRSMAEAQELLDRFRADVTGIMTPEQAEKFCQRFDAAKRDMLANPPPN